MEDPQKHGNLKFLKGALQYVSCQGFKKTKMRIQTYKPRHMASFLWITRMLYAFKVQRLVNYIIPAWFSLCVGSRNSQAHTYTDVKE